MTEYSLAAINAKAWQENLLMSVLVELTYRCNLDCFFCYNDLGLAGSPLSKQQYVDFFTELSEMQVLHLTLSGGEPLAHPDFFALGATARELGFLVRIKSNGHALRAGLAERIRDEIEPFILEISLHGASATTHDRQTRVPGSFERLLANLEELERLGLRVKLNATLTAWNEHELVGMFDLAQRLGLPLAMNPTVTPKDDGDTSPLSIAPSDEAVQRLFEERYRRLPEHENPSMTCRPDVPVIEVEKNCGAGSAGIAVDPFGNVYPCVQWRRSIGNLHRRSIREIWADSPQLSEIRRLTVEAQRRRGELGDLGSLINFCPGLSEEITGDPLGVEPDALRHSKLLQRAETKREESQTERRTTTSGLLPVVK